MMRVPYSGCFFSRSKFRPLLPLAKILSAIFFSCINDYTVDVATFTALVKINMVLHVMFRQQIRVRQSAKKTHNQMPYTVEHRLSELQLSEYVG